MFFKNLRDVFSPEDAPRLIVKALKDVITGNLKPTNFRHSGLDWQVSPVGYIYPTGFTCYTSMT